MKFLIGLAGLIVCWLLAVPAQAGCIATASPPTFSEGQATTNDYCDLKGNRWTSPGTLMSGEDQSATGANPSGVLVTEFRYLSSGTKTGDFQVKATPGFVHSLYCIGNDAAATAGTVIIYDNTAESGTQLFSLTITATDYSHTPIYVPLDTIAATGIYLGFTTTNDVACTVAYR